MEKEKAKHDDLDTLFMGSKEASKLWGVTQATVSRWCREGKIKGAEHDADGSPWRIPKTAVPPAR